MPVRHAPAPFLSPFGSLNRVPFTQHSMEIPIPSYTPPARWFLRIESSASRASPGATLTFNKARVVQDEQRAPLVIVDFKFTLSSNTSIRSTPAVRLEIGGILLDTKCCGGPQQTSIAAASLPWDFLNASLEPCQVTLQIVDSANGSQVVDFLDIGTLFFDSEHSPTNDEYKREEDIMTEQGRPNSGRPSPIEVPTAWSSSASRAVVPPTIVHPTIFPPVPEMHIVVPSQSRRVEFRRTADLIDFDGTALGKANLQFTNSVNDMTEDWNDQEMQDGRRLVQFWGRQEGNTIAIQHKVILQQDFEEGNLVVSCLWWPERKEHYFTSVDAIALAEFLLETTFTVPAKNRARRNIAVLNPITLPKVKNDRARTVNEKMFVKVMGYPPPKPRTIEKNIKVYRWKDLTSCLEKIIQKYTAVIVEPGPTSMTPEVLYDDQHEITSPNPVKPIRTRSQYKSTPSPSSASPSEIEETDLDTKDAEMSAPYFATGTSVIQKEPVFTGYVIGGSPEQDTQLVTPFGQFFHDFDIHSAHGPSPMDSHFSCESVSSPDGMLLSLPGDQITFSSGLGVPWGNDHYIHDQQFLFTVGNDEPPPASDLYSNLAYMPIEEPRKHAPMTFVIEDHKSDSL